MRILLQRVTRASVAVDDRTVGQIDTGILALVGFGQTDTPALPDSPAWPKMLDKLLNLRIFPDDQSSFNRSLLDMRGDLLLVSQFTLYAECKKGRRPSFSTACPPDTALQLFNRFVADAKSRAPAHVATGTFGAEMHLDLTNWGPVTILLDSEQM
ncbi:D-aminoacyl-tRNA deacylase [Pseudodesulfovibrio sp.]|uniref:D-aminoacyl-tRNA deacylase n=1 Tax=Pseudodesulfovibrio sp. TaxID=2035812 RepID=UPI00262965CD|nr:D-aminoacyl-tRNA deacylase [Pseudodesulfovibrio sp.]MDD3311040.1 D-aminoacyl-tRNA deacylase [Pseudodesulfovibrio sp.]